MWLMWHLCWVFKWHLWRWGLKGARYQTLDTGWSSSASLGLPCCVFRLRHRVSSSARGVCFFPNWRYCCGDKNGKVVPRGSLRCTESSLGHQIYADMPWKCEVGRTNTFAGKSFRFSTESEMSSLQILLRWVPAGSPLLCSRLFTHFNLSDFTCWVPGVPKYSIMIWHFAQQVCRYLSTATMSLSSRWAKGLHLRLPCAHTLNFGNS